METEAATVPVPVGKFMVVLLDDLRESPLNPRKHFNQAGLDELAASITAKGVLTPLLVRPVNGHYEIGAGHRRYRAARQAGAATVPVVAREMNDDDFLELLTVENLQRDDLHPLEEAQGYASLLRLPNYTIDKLAEKIGKKRTYVYDRLNLLKLIPQLQNEFLEDAFTVGHAVELARLTPSEQERVRGDDADLRYGGRSSGLYQTEQMILRTPSDEDRDAEDPKKPVSVKELKAYIDKHIRFDAKAPDAMLFPETAEAITSATEQREKIVHITHEYQVLPEAKAEGQRTYGPASWKRVDDKPCEYEATGVIVVGAGRGEAFKVCVRKDKCTVHWGKEIKGREKQAKGGSTAKTSEQTYWQKQESAYKAQQDKERATKERWDKARPALLEAVSKRVLALPATATGPLADVVMHRLRDLGKSLVPRGKSAEDFVRHAAFLTLASKAANNWQHEREEFTKLAKLVGVDTKKILDVAAPIEKPAAADKPAKKGKAKPTGKTKAAPKKRAAKKASVPAGAAAVDGDEE